jgi:DNA polymerase III alpha subunit
VIGLLSGIRERISKQRGEPFGILMLEDSESQIEAVCHSKQWHKVKPLLTAGEPYLVTGSLKSDGDLSMIIDSIEPLAEVRAKRSRAIRIKIATDGLPGDFYDSLNSELKKFPGNMTVLLDLRTEDEQALLRMRSVKVSMEPVLAERINKLSGGKAYVVQ